MTALLGVSHLFEANAESPPSSAGVGLLASENGSKGAFVVATPRLAGNTWHVTVGGGAAEIRYDSFGIGTESGVEGMGPPLASTTESAGQPF